MKPTLSNAFHENTPDSSKVDSTKVDMWAMTQAGSRARSNPRKSLAASLAPMQVDLREADFGWSLELSPIAAVDALEVVHQWVAGKQVSCLVNMEQSTWRDNENAMPIALVAERLSIPILEQFEGEDLALEELPLRQLVSLCQPTRLLVTLVEGSLDRRDVSAMNKAVEAGRSPLTAELRAFAALEVMGDRAVVLHCRDKNLALSMIAWNFRLYLGAVRNRQPNHFAAPETWQIERLLDATGVLTVRPIETQMFSTSIDVGINTTKERFGQPANRSLIYDIPSNSWHDEP